MVPMSSSHTASQNFPRWASFGDYRLDLHSHQLYRNDRRLSLPARSVQVLGLLVMHHGELVTREQLVEQVWGTQDIDPEASLNTAIRSIRRALSDNASDPSFIETAPRQGYRFLQSPDFSDSAAASITGDSGSRARQRTVSWALATVVMLVTVSMAVYRMSPDSGQGDDATEGTTDQGESLMQAYVSSAGYEDFMHGRYALSQGERDVARAHLEAAISADPDLAPAYVSLARVHVGQRRLGWDRIVAAQSLVDEAIRIDDRLVAAHVLKAGLSLYYWRDFELSQRHVEQALRLAANDPDALVVDAYLNVIGGRSERAVEAIARAHQLRPLSPSLNADYGWILYKAGHWVDAERLCKTSAELKNTSSFALECIIHINHSQGDVAEAVEYGLQLMALRGATESEITSVRMIRDAREREAAYWEWTLTWLRSNQHSVSDVHSKTGVALTMLGRLDEAVLVFEKAFERNGEPFLAFLAVDPRVDELTGHESFAALAGMSRSPLSNP